ncbi:hypothetical protein DSO57_1036128 [Entomophthora muscae]|uniref:Uncharacterized protein n=1 Tax=Entomophthora muscae TaxID=34485 RepID=A0ACC2TLG8_9FUNG|nr:hypothetical protein DSO57_1036128 [Entomophthora muscae]
MELQQGKSLVTVHTSRTNLVCDQCTSAHQKCSRDFPACKRCLKLSISCTRCRTKYNRKVVSGLSRAGWVLVSKVVVPSTWAQVIEKYPVASLSQFHMRRFVMPLVLLLPERATAVDFINMSSKVFTDIPHPQQREEIDHSINNIQHVLTAASEFFFTAFNPYYPLFSKEDFYSRPRSLLLNRIIIQIGLERIPETSLTQAAMRSLNLIPTDLLNLPTTLDTLQCLLLVRFGLKLSWVNNIHFKTFAQINRLVPLLGLHKSLIKSPQWLERTLAIHLINLGCFNVNVDLYISLTNENLLETRHNCLTTSFLQRMTSHFSYPASLIHFITSQTMYQSFNIVLIANERLTKALNERSSVTTFQATLVKKIKLLEETFKKAWHLLSTISQEKHLLLNSRVMLAIRYHYDYIELMKMAAYIPLNPTQPIHHIPTTTKISQFCINGLFMAIRNIRLVHAFSYTTLSLDYMFTLIPSISFILAYYKAFQSHYKNTDILDQALTQAKGILEIGLNNCTTCTQAKVYIDLTIFLSPAKRSP